MSSASRHLIVVLLIAATMIVGCSNRQFTLASHQSPENIASDEKIAQTASVSDPQGSAERLLKVAEKLARQGQLHKARQIYSLILSRHPEHREASRKLQQLETLEKRRQGRSKTHEPNGKPPGQHTQTRRGDGEMEQWGDGESKVESPESRGFSLPASTANPVSHAADSPPHQENREATNPGSPPSQRNRAATSLFPPAHEASFEQKSPPDRATVSRSGEHARAREKSTERSGEQATASSSMNQDTSNSSASDDVETVFRLKGLSHDAGQTPLALLEDAHGKIFVVSEGDRVPLPGPGGGKEAHVQRISHHAVRLQAADGRTLLIR